MNNRIVVILTLLVVAQTGLAQVTSKGKKNWVINEVYLSDSPKRYGLFIELYNPDHKQKKPYNIFLSTSRKDAYQLRLKGKYNPDFRQKGYMAYKASAVRFKMRSIRIYNKPDTLYLFERNANYEFTLQDAFPIIWNDSLSAGRCDNRICYFNMPTPGRENKNVSLAQIIPRRNYRVSVLAGVSSANNTDFAKVGYYPSIAVKVQKVVNRRTIYTGTSASIFFGGYSFREDSVKLESNVFTNLTRTVDGNTSVIGLWAGKDIGVFLTPRFDISCGAGLMFGTYTKQIYYETIKGDGNILLNHVKQNQTASNYGLPVVTFNAGLNYQLNSKWKIEFFHNIYFRTLSKNETIYYKSFTLGVSRSFREKGRGYKEGPGIFKYFF